MRAVQVSADGIRFAYAADQDTAGSIELYCGPVDAATTPVKVSGPLVAGARVDVRNFRFSPDGAWLVYLADANEVGKWELFGAPSDGSAPALRLNPPLVPAGDVGDEYGTAPFRIAPDSLRVVYLADQDTEGKLELYSVPIDGHALPIKLSGALPPEADVDGFSPGYAISPDGTRVAYAADRDVDQSLELFSVPIAGGAPPFKLSQPALPGRGLEGGNRPSFEFAPDGQRVVYRADLDADDRFALYSVPADGSLAPVSLSNLASGHGDVHEFALDSDGAFAVFRADTTIEHTFQLFSAPLDGSSAAQTISGAMVAGGDVDGAIDVARVLRPFEISVDGTRVVYRADALIDGKFELFAVPIAGGTAVRLNASLPFSRDVRHFRLARDGSCVLFLADVRRREFDELHCVRVDGDGDSRRVSQVMVTGGEVAVDYGASAGHAFFRADAELDERFELYAVPLPARFARRALFGSWPPRVPRKLHPTLAPDADIPSDFALTSGGLAVFLADVVTPRVTELFASSPESGAATRKLNAELTAGPAMGDVQEYGFAGERVVYTGSQRAEGFGEVFAVDPPAAPSFELLVGFPNYGSTAKALRITSDGARAVFVADREVNGRYELHSVLADGSTPAVRLSGPITPVGGDVEEDFVLDGPSERVVFRGALDVDSVIELFSAPLDGSLSAVKLHALSGQADVRTDFQVAPLTARVLFTADGAVDDAFDLYSVPIAGGEPAVRLNALLPPGGDVEGFRIAEDGSFAVYWADEEADGRFQIYRVPLDGSQAPVRLNGTLASGSVGNGFQITADGTRVIYVAEQDMNDIFELFSVVSDGSQPAVKLNQPFSFSGRVGEFVLDPSSARVVYAADPGAGSHVGVFSVPVDGSESPIEIGEPASSHNDEIEYLRMAPDGSSVLYLSGSGLPLELYCAPVLGSGAVELAEVWSSTGGFLFTPDSLSVILLNRDSANAAVELYRGPLDASAPLLELNDPLIPGGNVTSFRVAPDGNSVLYRADQDEDEVFELFLLNLVSP